MSVNKVEAMPVIPDDPNKPLVDVDKHTEEHMIMADLFIHAEARFAGFMDMSRKLREGTNLQDDVETFTDQFVELFFSGRTPLPSTDKHKNLMRLVLRATLINRLSPAALAD